MQLPKWLIQFYFSQIFNTKILLFSLLNENIWGCSHKNFHCARRMIGEISNFKLNIFFSNKIYLNIKQYIKNPILTYFSLVIIIFLYAYFILFLTSYFIQSFILARNYLYRKSNKIIICKLCKITILKDNINTLVEILRFWF